MRLFRSLYGVLLLLLFGISASSPPSISSTIPLEVEHTGCKAFLMPGSVCVLEPGREMRLWVKTSLEGRIEIRAGGERIDAVGEPAGQGQRFALKIPAGAETVSVLVQSPDGAAAWSLDLRLQVRQTRLEGARDLIEESRQTAALLNQWIEGLQLAAARETLDGLRLPPKAPALSRCIESFYRGRLAEKEGDYRTALAEMQNVVEIARRVKEEEVQWQAEETLGLLLLGVGRSRDSVEIFERLSRMSQAQKPCNRAPLLTNQAWSVLLAREAGESFEDPTPLFESALEMYEPCKSFKPGKRINLLINLALAHWQEGRLEQAKDRLDQARKLEAHATLFHRLWWLDLEARIALREDLPAEALSRFQSLEELALETTSPEGRLQAAFGQAQSQEALGDRNAALEDLEKAEALLDEQSLQIPLHEGRETFMATRQAMVSLHLDLLLKEGRKPDALSVARHARSRMLRQLERSDRLASLTPDQRTRWDLLVKTYQQKRAAREERIRNKWKLAVDQLPREEAEERAEAAELHRLLDRLFLLLRDPEEPPGAALPPPQPGELLLTYYPLPSGWAGFATDGKTVSVHRFDLPPAVLSNPRELSRRLLLPFRAEIERAERIRVLPTGTLQGVDFHALPFAGDVLLAKRPVVYGLDLPVPPGSPRPAGRKALVVADPSGDLPGTLAEVQAVERSLDAWTVEALKSAEASAETVQSRLVAADLFHYAGHGVFSGSGGWESRLRLAEDTQLTLGDLLALERVPAWVVLSACEGGRSSSETPVESLGLAHAFLLAGSRAVIASSRLADDREVPRFFSDLYEEWGREPDLDLAVALQRAQLSWRQRNPGADWEGFRLFVP